MKRVYFLLENFEIGVEIILKLVLIYNLVFLLKDIIKFLIYIMSFYSIVICFKIEIFRLDCIIVD